jgi:oxidase EvaA
MENVFSSLFTFDSEFIKESELLKWLDARNRANEFIVKPVPFRELDKWKFNEETGYLQHDSGKFFSIEGLKVHTDFGEVPSWEQVIINQPEVGILGIMTKVINGTRYFLMQAKMEPGNINILQISPTLQATRSNYKLAHKGKTPLYLEYFIDRTRSTIIIDQLQSEQGGRFLRKRNRNMIVEIKDDIEVFDDFLWMTLGQIKILMQYDNIINMDARSVISCIPFHLAKDKKEVSSHDVKSKSDPKMIASLSDDVNDIYSLEEQLSWINEQKLSYSLHIQQVPITQLNDWQITPTCIRHKTKPFFEVIGVDVKAGNREVSSWTQPLVSDRNLGLIGFIVKEINNKFYFLVQAKVEPGNIDLVDMAPTISISNYERFAELSGTKPFCYDVFKSANPGNIIYDKIHSEEGGRFYHLQNRYMIVIDNTIDEYSIPANFRFMTLEQILVLGQYGFFNIESRGLISCIDFFMTKI